MKKGLVSVTFRSLSCGDIVKLCKKADLEYIEWGGDIHIPSGDIKKAAEVKRLCAENGLVPLGYGSYYNAADGTDGFYAPLDTALALGAEYIRIWAGKSREYSEAAEENIKKAVAAANERGIAVTLECHRKTMTEDAELAVKLARECGCLLHFQPNPDIPFEKNLHALEISKPYLCAVHTFAWEQGGALRLPLSAHRDMWRQYVKTAPDAPYLLEFVEDDKPENLIRDAGTVDELLNEYK